MSLLEQIDGDFKTAFKAHEPARVSTLRMLKAALKNKQIELLHALSEEEIRAVVKTQIKQLKDAAETYQQGGRADLAEASLFEISVLEAYLPAQLGEEELEGIVKQALEESGVRTRDDMGRAMGIVMKAVAGRADGNRVRSVVERLLPVFAFVLVAGLLAASPALAASASSRLLPSADLIENIVRVARVFLILIGLVCINTLLVSAVQIITSGNRESVAMSSRKKITEALLGSLLIAVLFTAATLFLSRVGT